MSSRNSSKGILVFVEETHGVIADVSLELLAKGEELAKKSKQFLLGVLLTPAASANLNELQHLGLDTLIVAEHKAFTYYLTYPFANTLTKIIEKYSPSIVLLGATSSGRDLAPRVAARLQTGLSADCIDLDIDEDGLLRQIKPTFGGEVMAEIICPKARPQMATVRPHVFDRPQKHATIKTELIEFGVDDEDVADPLHIIGEETGSAVCYRLEEAQAIVCGGRGLGDAETFDLCRQLAESLGGMPAGTRPVVEEGWVDRAQQVGLSGKTVRPDLLILCGISGAVSFTVGIENTKTIVAINQDPKAAIFDYADYGLVGDVREILPLLIEKIKNLK